MAGDIPLVAHVIFRLDTGGMENGLVNLINRTSAGRYRHAIVCLTDAGPFANRIAVPDVPIIRLRQPPGHSFAVYFKLWRVLRTLAPAIIHTRNLAALEAQIPASFLPGTKRVHGEHGRDLFDLYGHSKKYNALRRLIKPLVHRYIAVSRDLETWLEETVGVAPQKLRRIYNGVAADLFHAGDASVKDAPPGFCDPGVIVVGSVGRLAGVKDQATFLRAAGLIIARNPVLGRRLRLVLVGDGPARPDLERLVRDLGLAPQLWFAGDRGDIPDVLRMMDIFVLTSLGEGISNTVLEAMATALPVIATKVGGNPELVFPGVTGFLVPAQDPRSVATAVELYCDDADLRVQHGHAGRRFVESVFDWDRCVGEYLDVYDGLLAGQRQGRAPQD
jgi:sugar transferase (PEP-CTERM/EpsH1 system associated)